MIDDIKKLDALSRHIKTVQDNCQKVAERLIENKEFEFAKLLIANSLQHDRSKFFGVEWDYLNDDAHKDKFEIALHQHVTTNKHHIEYWGSAAEMPRIYVAEMVCDVTARSSEFGTDVREWIDEKATKKYKFSKNGKVYKEIKEFLDLLLEKPF